jgi:hypothetical protein
MFRFFRRHLAVFSLLVPSPHANKNGAGEKRQGKAATGKHQRSAISQPASNVSSIRIKSPAVTCRLRIGSR